MNGGVVLSHASSMTGTIVTLSDDPAGLKARIEAAQPGCVATVVTDDGDGWRSVDGRTPEQILAEFEARS